MGSKRTRLRSTVGNPIIRPPTKIWPYKQGERIKEVFNVSIVTLNRITFSSKINNGSVVVVIYDTVRKYQSCDFTLAPDWSEHRRKRRVHALCPLLVSSLFLLSTCSREFQSSCSDSSSVFCSFFLMSICLGDSSSLVIRLDWNPSSFSLSLLGESGPSSLLSDPALTRTSRAGSVSRWRKSRDRLSPSNPSLLLCTPYMK